MKRDSRLESLEAQACNKEVCSRRHGRQEYLKINYVLQIRVWLPDRNSEVLLCHLNGIEAHVKVRAGNILDSLNSMHGVDWDLFELPSNKRKMISNVCIPPH